MVEKMEPMQLVRNDGKLYAITESGNLTHVGWLLPQVRRERDRKLREKELDRIDQTWCDEYE